MTRARSKTRAALLGAALWTGAALAATTAHDARACGGCFHPPSQSGTVVTDHRMIFAVSPGQTTLYDEIEYQGSPSDFAWVLPIKGPVTVGVSSDILFSSIDQATQTTIVAPSLAPCPSCARNAPLPLPPSAAGGDHSGSVTVLSMSVVGPYEQVQLQSSSPTALEAWLSGHSYVIPSNVQPVVAAYVAEGFDFLAIRLVPGQGVQAMRPISVTTPGAGLSLPLRMVAAGTGATVGITLWVIATGRYEPMNFPMFTIAGSELTWDFSTNLSDYTTVQKTREGALNNAAWQIESSLDMSPYQIENPILADAPEADYLSASAPSSGSGSGSGDGGVAGGGSGDAAGGGGATLTPDAVRTRDLATCFPGGSANVRITRMRADLTQAALAHDLVLQAAQDQGTLSNVYQVTRSKNAPACPPYNALACLGQGAGGASGGGSSSCAAAAPDSRGGGFELALAGLVAAALARSRARKR